MGVRERSLALTTGASWDGTTLHVGPVRLEGAHPQDADTVAAALS
jgi:hypothetical protein